MSRLARRLVSAAGLPRVFPRRVDDKIDRYATFLERSFLKIREAGVENLIVDLRGNGGGRDVHGACHKRGIFIGRESGGGYYGNTSGMRYRLTLPHTGLQVGIPIVKYVSAVEGNPYPDRGIIPDFLVEPTIQDLLAGKDPVMEAALARVR